MPIYAYECTECGAIEEELRKISEREEPILCPRDGKKMLPVLSRPSPLRKGAGIYSIDDSSSGNWGNYDD